MGISSALYSGVSGLNTNSQAMTVIGNNLANTNTVGFKGARTVFSDLLSSTISGSGGFSQVGRGVGVSKVNSIFSQGTFQTTDSPLDAAIQGSGFFLLKKPDDNTTYYSRAGAFHLDDNGYLVNPEGLRVQGQAYDTTTGTLVPGNPTAIQVANRGLVGGQTTSAITLTTNLNSSATSLPFANIDITDPTTYNYSSSTQVYDSLGDPHLITFYFNKEAAANTWDWSWTSEDSSGNILPTGLGANKSQLGGQLVFDTSGNLNASFDAGGAATSPTGSGTIAGTDLAWGNGSTSSDIALTFDTTQFNSASVVISQDQNGYGAGNLSDVSIDKNGVLVASYSNGKKVDISNLVLGKFTNPEGLKADGNNLFEETSDSGPARTGLPGPELGSVFTNSLEQSNVDMGQQFVDMITTQRGFDANSKIITTVDDMLTELISLKR